MRTLCYSVRLESLTQISDKCYKARAFDGSSALIPASQVFGQDWDVQKCDAWWVSAWILGQRPELQSSMKKKAYFDSKSRRRLPDVTVEHFTPEKVEAVESNEIEELKR